MTQNLSHLAELEAESIEIFREVIAEFSRPVMLYSIGKDSSVMLRLAQKAFYPLKPPFPLLHIDTSFKFGEMIQFRDRVAAELGMHLIVHSATKELTNGMNPFRFSTQKCCAALKTGALLEALAQGGFDAAIGGARRDEEKSRAKERVYSFRDDRGQWDPKNQRPELWNIYNGRINKGESIRVFPLSNWTELDVWEYIRAENIPVVPLYFARERAMLVQGDSLISPEHNPPVMTDLKPVPVVSRMRSLGCTYCTGAIRSSARDVDEIIEEIRHARRSERENRVIDHDQEGSMEQKKQEGYF